MLTKVIDQSKIDHFAKWLERADKIVIVPMWLPTEMQ
jgi:phosphoesterase RecJ-like protein